MASKPSRAEQIRATPAKLVLIGVLGVVLIAVLYVQFGRSSEDSTLTAGELSARRRPEVSQTVANQEVDPVVTAVSSEGKNQRNFDKWRPPKLPVVIQHDPFALPASFPQPRPTGVEATLAQLGEQSGDQSAETLASLEERIQQSRAELEALRHLGVQVIMRQDDGYVAMIGDRTIHVGDEINGFIVIGIDSNGVHVARELKP